MGYQGSVEYTIQNLSMLSKHVKYLNISHYNTVLDENIDISELKQKIIGIFSGTFDNFFSDYYPEELGGKINIYKTEIKYNNDGFTVFGLDGIKINFKFLEHPGLTKIDIDFNFPTEKLSFKEELYVETIIGYLELFGLKLTVKENMTHKPISCKNGVCNFVGHLKKDINELQKDYEKQILESLIKDDWKTINTLLIKIDNKDLKEKILELRHIRKELSLEDSNKEISKKYSNSKIDIVFGIISRRYRELILTVDTYISAISIELENNNTSEQLEGLLDMNSPLDKTDKLIFIQIKHILAEYKKVYLKKLEDISLLLMKEKQKKNLLALSVELLGELPIIEDIQRKIPLSTKIKFGLKNIFSGTENDGVSKKYATKDTEKQINDRKNRFDKIRSCVEKGGFIINYQLFLKNCNGEVLDNFSKKEDGLYYSDKKVLTMVECVPITEIMDIDVSGDFIDKSRYKIARTVYNTMVLVNIKNDLLFNYIDRYELTGKYIDIDGIRFIQLKRRNFNEIFYIDLERFWPLHTYNYAVFTNQIFDIETETPIIINGKRYFNVKRTDGDILICFDEAKIEYASDYSYHPELRGNCFLVYKKFYRGYANGIKKVKNAEYYVFKRGNNIRYINKATGEYLEKEIETKLKSIVSSSNSYSIEKIIFGEEYIEVYIGEDRKLLFDGKEFVR